MPLLLDTHVWIWALLEPDRLGAGAARLLRAEDAELWLSPISIWEALLLAEKGRIQVDRDPSGWVRDALGAMPVRDAPLNREVAIASRTVKLEHGDPADRFLAATALSHGLKLVTADRRLLKSPACDTVDASGS